MKETPKWRTSGQSCIGQEGNWTNTIEIHSAGFKYKVFLFTFVPVSVCPIFILSTRSVVENVEGLSDGTGAIRKQITLWICDITSADFNVSANFMHLTKITICNKFHVVCLISIVFDDDTHLNFENKIERVHMKNMMCDTRCEHILMNSDYFDYQDYDERSLCTQKHRHERLIKWKFSGVNTSADTWLSASRENVNHRSLE